MDEFLDYKVVEILYEGHDILVFRGEHNAGHTRHIVKALVATSKVPEQVTAFRREYQINHMLNLHGLVHCQQLIEKGDKHLLVFEDAGGTTLRNLLEDQALDLDRFFPIAIGIVECLEELHSSRVIHKDIKPDNILVDPETLGVKLLDLSIATQLTNENHEAVVVDKLEGSLPYMAPEQTGRMNRPMDYRSDYYALGFTLFEMLTGKVPFECADALGYVHFHMAVMPDPPSSLNPNVPEMLSKIVGKLVSKQAEDRYQSTEGLRADLERCFQEWHIKKEIPEFPLGEHEAYYKLVVSPKIFGRDEEIACLMSTFDRVVRGASECLLISGHSGVGKSRLVNEVQRPISRQKGYFVQSKFDQLQKATPYTAFTEVFTILFKNWLTESETKLNQRKEKLLKALGHHGQVIIEFFPYLERVIGKQPEIEKLAPELAQNRFLYHFHNFVECISSPEEPLVIFIDDLQWIDQGSLRLLEIILSTQNVQSLLFIGAYRDNEVDEYHPFSMLMDKVKKANGVVNDIVLQPLKLVHTEEYLADSLRMEGKNVQPLAKLLFEKTAGNPFFALEFLKECFVQKFLTYDHKECLWHWDLEKIAGMSGTDNVIDLMLTKIAQLPPLSQKMLQTGACLGTIFDGELLREILDIDELSLLEALSPVLKAGMVQRIDKGLRYKFIHDRVQQAAYQTVVEGEKEKLHLAIGRILLPHMEHRENEDGIFEAVDHFKRAAHIIDSKDERLKTAELALRAGKQVIDAGAYDAAAGYLTFGIELLKDFDWEQNYSLLWNLNMELTSTFYYQGKALEALVLGDQLLLKTKGGIDQARVYLVQMNVNHNILRDYNATIELGRKAYSCFGFKMPSQNYPTLSLMTAYAMIKFWYGKGKKLVKALRTEQRIGGAESEILYNINYLMPSSFHYINKSSLAHTIVFLHMMYKRKNGLVTDADMVYFLSFWGQVAFSFNKDIEEFGIYAEASKKIINDPSFDAGNKADANYLFCTNASYFDKLEDVAALAEEITQALVENGKFAYLSRMVNLNLSYFGFLDKPLPDVRRKAKECMSLSSKINIPALVEVFKLVIRDCDYLMQENKVTWEDVKDPIPESLRDYGLLYIFKAYLSEEYAQAKVMIDINHGHFATTTCLPKIIYSVISILNMAQLYPGATYLERWTYKKDIRRRVRELKVISRQNPGNFLHLYILGQAELARIWGRRQKAISLYKKAIDAARGQAYLRWAAIAKERLAELYMESGEAAAAAGYIHQAIYYFEHWGCKLKVKLLIKKYGAILVEQHLRDEEDVKKSDSTSTSTGGKLDLAAMLKASQAISSEIQLDKLLPRILQVLIESAGADKAAFIGLKKDDWVIESLAELKKGKFISTPMTEILTQESDLPEEVISGVIRLAEMQVISDLTQHDKYSSLPYVRKYQTKSALCLPIIRDKKVVAALYLENQITADTFTPERVQLLKALSSQIAISLENARYFERTQELFRSTERFVPKKFLELLGRNNIEEVAKGDNVKLEMSALFADLRDFTTISENIEPEQLTFVLNTYLKYMSPIIRNNHGFVNRVLGDGILALFPNDPQDAVQASVEMLEALKLFNQEINTAGLESIQMGIGVNTGPAMLCALGEEERIEANVVSDMVNAASRIEGLNKLYGTKLLISNLTFDRLKDTSRYCIRMVDTVRVKGKAKPLGLYEVMPKIDGENYIDGFHNALALYTKGSFKEASQKFEKCLVLRPDDAVAQLYADRCKAYQDNIPENWDGVTTMLEK